MKRLFQILITLIILFLAVVGTVWVVMNTSLGLPFVEHFIASRFNIPIQVDVDRISSNLISEVHLQQITAEWKEKQKTLVTAEVGKVRVSTDGWLWGAASSYRVAFEDVSFRGPAMSVKGMKGKIPIYVLGVHHKEDVPNLLLEELRIQEIMLKQFAAQIWVQRNTVHVDAFQANVFKGQLRGKAVIEMGQPSQFDMELFFDHFDAKELSRLNNPLFENWRGFVSGKMQVRGTGNHFSFLELQLLSDAGGGSFNSELIRPMLKYLPQQEVSLIEQTLTKAPLLDYDDAEVHVLRLEDNLYIADIRILTGRYPIDLSVKLDIRLDGDPMSTLLRVLKEAGLEE